MNKERFINLYKANIHREGADKLLEWLETTDFFTAPSSTRFHGAYEGCLVEHSLNVFERLDFMLGIDYGGAPFNDSFEYPGIERISIVSLLHDICKVNFYIQEKKSRKTGQTLSNGKPEWEDYIGYSVDEKFPFGHGEKSVFLIERFMKLTAEEAVAIRFHMGAYEGEKMWNTVSSAFEKYPLAFHLHFADMQATYLDEKRD